MSSEKGGLRGSADERAEVPGAREAFARLPEAAEPRPGSGVQPRVRAGSGQANRQTAQGDPVGR